MEQKVGEIFKDDAKKAREILNLSIQVVFFSKSVKGILLTSLTLKKSFQ